MATFNDKKLKKLKKIDALISSIYLFPRNKKIRQQVTKGTVDNILIMSIMMIGDTIMLIPVLKVLKRTFPKASITLICEPVVEVILADQDLVEKFIIVKTPWLNKNFSTNSIFKLLKGVLTANKHRYDLAIDFRGDWRNIFLMNFINAERKISFNYSGGEYMLTDVVPANDGIKHHIDKWLYLLNWMGCEIKVDDKYPSLIQTVSSFQVSKNFVSNNALTGKLIIGIHPGASVKLRRWDEQKYADTILQISTNYAGSAFILFQGPGEEETVEIIQRGLNGSEVTVITVVESLKNYISIMNCCDVVVCNDSGAGHIAGALGKPSVVIFGDADPEEVKPYNKNTTKIISCLKGSTYDGNNIIPDGKRLASITVIDVVKAIDELIAANHSIENE